MTISNNQLATNMEALGNLYLLQSILTTLSTNLSLISEGARGKKITASNINLYQLAAQEYGDATQWTAIATANGLSDPLVTGGAIILVNIIAGGSGYLNPIVNIVGNQTINANLTAVMVDGVITQVQVVTGGNYLGQPELEIWDGINNDGPGAGAIVVPVCAATIVIPQNPVATGGVYSV